MEPSTSSIGNVFICVSMTGSVCFAEGTGCGKIEGNRELIRELMPTVLVFTHKQMPYTIQFIYSPNP